MVNSSAHHTVLLTPQTASTSLEEELGQCSGILCVLFAWHIMGILSCKKKNNNATSKRLWRKRHSQWLYDERKPKHVNNSSVLLLRCHVDPWSCSKSRSVEGKPSPTLKKYTGQLHSVLTKPDLRLASSPCPIGPESASGCSSCVTAMQRLN